jgi:hypothetical protein
MLETLKTHRIKLLIVAMTLAVVAVIAIPHAQAHTCPSGTCHWYSHACLSAGTIVCVAPPPSTAVQCQCSGQPGGGTSCGMFFYGFCR